MNVKKCKGIRVKCDNKHWCDYVPTLVETGRGGKVTILWNQQVQTDRTIPNTRRDIIIRDNKQGTCMLIDAAFPGDRNVIRIEAEISKYKDLTTEIQRKRNVKTKVTAVITGATGTISKHLESTCATYREITTLMNCKQQPYWSLHTDCGKC